MKYTSKAFDIKLDNGDTVFVRAITKSANIPGVGLVNLPEYFSSQARLQGEIEKAKKGKKPAAEILAMESKMSLPRLLDDYLDSKSASSVFVIAKTAKGFPVSEEEAVDDVNALKKENAALVARVKELEAKAESEPPKK